MKIFPIRGMHLLVCVILVVPKVEAFAGFGGKDKKVTVQSETTVNKLFHNRSAEDVLELGSVVFYFSREPELTKLPTKKGSGKLQQLVYFFPGAVLSSTAKQMLKSFYGQEHAGYQVTIKPVSTGVKVVVAYDDTKVEVNESPKFFITHDNQQAVVLRFNNKLLLEKLNTHEVALLKTAQAKTPKVIVVDCGHGGTDFGTLGKYLVPEKDVALGVGLQVAQLLKNDGFEVYLTRDSDMTLALDERTTLANKLKADLFVSIHANYAAKNSVAGIETFSLKDSLFRPCLETQCSHTNTINAWRHERHQKSNLLASCLQYNILESVKSMNPHPVNRGIKYAGTQLLVGSIMPVALVELGFMSNVGTANKLGEAELLVDKEYQHLLAQGVRNGVVQFCRA